MCSTVNLCLLCLTNDENRKSVLSQDKEGIIFEEKCRYILNGNVNIRPEVSFICLNCLNNLNYVYKFKQMCLQNIKTFNNYLDTLETKKHLKVTLTDLQFENKIDLTCNNESANEISLPMEVVLIKEEISDDSAFQEGEEAIENDQFSIPEKPENMNDNMQYSSSSNEKHYIIGNFLNKVKKETEFNLIPEEIQIKDERLFAATDSDSEDKSNNKLVNEATNKSDNFNDEPSTADDDKKTSKNCNSTFSKGGKNKGIDVKSVKYRKCDKCYKAFTYPSDLKRHRRTHTGERPFKCTTCKKTFTTVRILKIQNRAHTGEKPYECDVCDKKFPTKTQLVVHKRTHNNERPFECSLCDRAFTERGKLTGHMRTHTGEKPFKCQVCQYECTMSFSLKIHMRIHTGEKPFKCELCQYKCAQAVHLKTHMRIHTGEKPFQCQICPYKCSRVDNLKMHMRKHTGEKPFACQHCQKAFSSSSSLKMHVRTMHSDTI